MPRALLHNLAHKNALHQRVVFLKVHNANLPIFSIDQQTDIADLGHGFHQIDFHYRLKKDRNVPHAAELCEARGLVFSMMENSGFTSCQTVVVMPGTGMEPWREAVSTTLDRNARNVADYYRSPANRVVELRTKLEI